MNTNDSCIICFEYQYKITFPCQHMICIECYQKLLHYEITTCPICRQPIELIQVDTESSQVQLNLRRDSDSVLIEPVEEPSYEIEHSVENTHTRHYVARICCCTIFLFVGVYGLLLVISK